MKTIIATYRNGKLDPTEALDYAEGEKLEISIRKAPIPSAEEEEAIEEMRRRFPNLVGTLTPEEAEEMMHLIDEEFGQIDPDQWK